MKSLSAGYELLLVNRQTVRLAHVARVINTSQLQLQIHQNGFSEKKITTLTISR